MKVSVTAEDIEFFTVGYKLGKWIFEDINKDNIEVRMDSGKMSMSPELVVQANVGYISIAKAEVVLPKGLLPYFKGIYRKDSDYKESMGYDSSESLGSDIGATRTVVPVMVYEFDIPADSDIFKSLVGNFLIGNMKATMLHLAVVVKSLYPVRVEELFSGSYDLQVSFKSKNLSKIEGQRKIENNGNNC